MSLAERGSRPFNSYLNWNIGSNQTLIIKLFYVKLLDVFDLGINSNSNQFLNAVNNESITITATIERYKLILSEYIILFLLFLF
jgi:hypothetical protein